MVKFSIVIPTKQRHETLGATIKTVLEQDFKDFEIVISDNFSSSETRVIVDSFNSEQIKYFRTESSIAMIDNWEFALSKATGEYTIFLGDDDGLIKDSLKALNEIIKATKFQVVQWERIYYSWPNMEPAVFANKLHIRQNSENRIVDGKKIIEDVIKGTVDYTYLPMLYNSAVHFSFIDQQVKNTGRFFHSIVPDLYSGFLLAHLAGKYLSLGVPMSINAGSLKSNGASFMFKKRSQQINEDFKNLNDSSTIPFDESIPYVRSLYAVIFEPYLKFLKTTGGSYSFDKTEGFQTIIQKMIVYDKEELEEFSLIVREKALKENINLKIIDEELNKVKIMSIDNFESPKRGFQQKELVLDASDFGLKDVADVAIFTSRFYDYSIFENGNSSFVSLSGHKDETLKLSDRVKKAVKLLIKGNV